MFVNKDFKSLFDLMEAFPTEQSCIDHLTLLRWRDGNIESPFNSKSKVYTCKGNRYKCKESGKYFNVKTGTFFEDSKIELRKWFIAIYLVSNHKRGISSYQLAEDIGVTQKTAWFMLHRIRAAFGLSIENDDDQLNGTVEADETFVGGKNKNRHKDKKVPKSQGRSFKDKTPVLGLLQRAEVQTVTRKHKFIKGKLVEEKIVIKDSKIKGFVVSDTKRSTLQPIIFKNVELDSRFMSDEWHGYKGLNQYYDHNIVDHAKKEYVNPNDPTIHTNTVEGAWSHLKRAIIGIYYQVTKKHLQKYVDGFAFRYNTKLLDSGSRFNLVLSSSNVRLKYADLKRST